MFFRSADQKKKDYYLELASRDELPAAHQQFLLSLRDERGFQPGVCYDIGANLLHWAKVAQRTWPQSQMILFDAFEPLEFLYGNHPYHIGVLSDSNDRTVRFYQNDTFTTGNSYYKESNDNVFPPSAYAEKQTRTLDSVVSERGFPLPDLVKIDVQGAEIDVLSGAQLVLRSAKYLIVEMQHKDYNLGAPKVDTSLPFIESMHDGSWRCIAHRFSDNGADADYCFENLAPQLSA